MTDAEWEELESDAEAYFEHHLDGPAWRSMSAVRKRAAVTTAALDVAALLHRRTVDWSSPAQRAATFEQGLFLRRCAEEPPAVLAENIEGVGGRTYQPPAAANREFSERALRLLNDWIRPGSVPVNRG